MNANDGFDRTPLLGRLMPADRNQPQSSAAQLSRGLGLLSLGLGMAGLLAPKGLARTMGVKDSGGNSAVLRMTGMRELAQGAGILRSSQPAGWVWTRVAGDVMDVSFVGLKLLTGDTRRGGQSMATLAMLLGIAAADVYCATQLSGDSLGREQVLKAVTIRRPQADVYRYWRDFEKLPRFMNNLESVHVTGERTSHWRAVGPAGRTVEWDAEIVEDRPNEAIAWRSTGSSQVSNSGRVTFKAAPGDRGTEVHVEMGYEPPAGQLGRMIATVFGREPSMQVESDLHRFKQIMETGEVIRSDAVQRGAWLPQHSAQPTEQTAGASR